MTVTLQPNWNGDRPPGEGNRGAGRDGERTGSGRGGDAGGQHGLQRGGDGLQRERPQGGQRVDERCDRIVGPGLKTGRIEVTGHAQVEAVAHGAHHFADAALQGRTGEAGELIENQRQGARDGGTGELTEPGGIGIDGKVGAGLRAHEDAHAGADVEINGAPAGRCARQSERNAEAGLRRDTGRQGEREGAGRDQTSGRSDDRRKGTRVEVQAEAQMAVHRIGRNGDAGGETPLTGIAGDADNRLEGIEQGHDARRGKSGAEGGFVLEPAGGVLQQSGRKQHAALTVDGRGEQTDGVEREVDNGLGGVVERAQILKGQAQAFGRHQVRQHAFQSGLVRHGPQRNEFRRGQAGPVPRQCQVWCRRRFQCHYRAARGRGSGRSQGEGGAGRACGGCLHIGGPMEHPERTGRAGRVPRERARGQIDGDTGQAGEQLIQRCLDGGAPRGVRQGGGHMRGGIVQQMVDGVGYGAAGSGQDTEPAQQAEQRVHGGRGSGGCFQALRHQRQEHAHFGQGRCNGAGARRADDPAFAFDAEDRGFVQDDFGVGIAAVERNAEVGFEPAQGFRGAIARAQPGAGTPDEPCARAADFEMNVQTPARREARGIDAHEVELAEAGDRDAGFAGRDGQTQTEAGLRYRTPRGGSARHGACGQSGGGNGRDGGQHGIARHYAEVGMHVEPGARNDGHGGRTDFPAGIADRQKIGERVHQAAALREHGVVGFGCVRTGQQRAEQTQGVGRGLIVEHGEGDGPQGRAGGDDGADERKRIGRAQGGPTGGAFGDQDDVVVPQGGEGCEHALQARDLPGDAVGVARGKPSVRPLGQRDEPFARGGSGQRERSRDRDPAHARRSPIRPAAWHRRGARRCGSRWRAGDRRGPPDPRRRRGA